MSTNISKQKRDDLIAKIGEIRKYISSAPQDENTGNLLTCLSELEKDVRGKKTTQKRAKVPSKEFSDAMVEAFKDKLKQV